MEAKRSLEIKTERMYHPSKDSVDTRHRSQPPSEAGDTTQSTHHSEGANCIGNPAIVPIAGVRPVALRPHLSNGCALNALNAISCFKCINSIYIILIK